MPKRFVCAACSVLFSFTAIAQSGSCTEQVIRKAIAVGKTSDRDYIANYVADEVYLFTGAFNKPIVGKSNAQTEYKQVTDSRVNEKWEGEHVDRIAISPGANMAYDYGTDHGSFDDKKTGKHEDVTTAYLRVWKNVAGNCKVVAVMAEPEGER